MAVSLTSLCTTAIRSRFPVHLAAIQLEEVLPLKSTIARDKSTANPLSANRDECKQGRGQFLFFNYLILIEF
jgi:hypothetical protein